MLSTAPRRIKLRWSQYGRGWISYTSLLVLVSIMYQRKRSKLKSEHKGHLIQINVEP